MAEPFPPLGGIPDPGRAEVVGLDCLLQISEPPHHGEEVVASHTNIDAQVLQLSGLPVSAQPSAVATSWKAAGLTCMRPTALRDDLARGLNPLSTRMMARRTRESRS